MHTHLFLAVTPGDDGGECFLVERYESDVEEEGGASASNHTPKKAVKGEKQLMLVISERFLEEKSSMGDKVQCICTCALYSMFLILFVVQIFVFMYIWNILFVQHSCLLLLFSCTFSSWIDGI